MKKRFFKILGLAIWGLGAMSAQAQNVIAWSNSGAAAVPTLASTDVAATAAGIHLALKTNNLANTNCNPAPTSANTFMGGDAFAGPLCAGQPATFYAELQGYSFTCQWFINDTLVDAPCGPFTTDRLKNGDKVSVAMTPVNINLCSYPTLVREKVVTVNLSPVVPSITTSGSTTLSNGESVTLSTDGSYFNYLWSNGATTPSITVSSAGSYTVRAISTICTSAASAPILVTLATSCSTPATPTISASGETSFCSGGSVTLTSSATSGNVWSNGATTQSITVSADGNYSVRVISGTCTSAVSAATEVNVLPAPSAPTISASGSTTLALGESVVLTSSLADAYLWSNGATTRSITVSTSGSYSVMAVENGCTSAASSAITVTANTTVVVTACDAPPASIDFARLGSTVAYLSWTANNQALNYRVWWRKVGTTNYFASSWMQPSSLTYKIEGLVPNTDYQMYLAVRCSSTGTWSNSAIVNFKTKNDLCVAPAISPSSLGKNSVLMSGFTFSGITKYELQWKSVASSSWSGATVTTSTYKIANLLANTSYNYRVRAICATTNDYTAYASGSFTTAAAVACTAPTPESSAQTLNSITINWAAVEASSYMVRWQAQGASTWKTAAVVGTSYVISNLAAGTYNVQLQAKCTPLGEWSEVGSSLVVTLGGAAREGIAESINVTLYPNPSAGNVNINLEGSENATYAVYNLVGKIVAEGDINGTTAEMNLSNEPNGVYLLKVVSGNSVTTKQVIINR